MHPKHFNSFPTNPAGGNPLSLSDDSFETVSLAHSKKVSLYGTKYRKFYVGSNGYVTFGSGDTTYTTSLATHFALPRISALFDDLDPSHGGHISWKQLDDRVAVTYKDVPEYNTTNINSFQIELFFDGRIRITLLEVDATNAVVGLSAGNGIPVGFEESDFTNYEYPQLTLKVPAQATENAGVLQNAGEVQINQPLPNRLDISLSFERFELGGGPRDRLHSGGTHEGAVQHYDGG
ncbi:MAG: hypothetical protein QM796_00830 [Chthoniobacteraceae bacterium]